jgi:predicted transcriptional regulator
MKGIDKRSYHKCQNKSTLLYILDRVGGFGLSASTLASMIGVTKQAMHGYLRELMSEHFIVRTVDKTYRLSQLEKGVHMGHSFEYWLDNGKIYAIQKKESVLTQYEYWNVIDVS